MELKKSKEANLNSRSLPLRSAGLFVALAVLLISIEHKEFEIVYRELADLELEVEEMEIIPITRMKPKPPPPPPPKPTVIEIVEDEEEIEEEIEIEDEPDEDTEVEIVEDYEEEEVGEVEPEIFTIVEDMPEFPGGQGEMMKYLRKNVKYPPLAKDAGIQGRVFVTFVVGKDGQVTDVKVMKGIGYGCDEEALRVVEKMPAWKPGKQRGKAVKVQFNLPITFRLK